MFVKRAGHWRNASDRHVCILLYKSEYEICHCFVLLFLISSCGIEDEPKVSQKEIQTNNIVGSWSFESTQAGKTSVATLELDQTGTFTIVGSFDSDGNGNWKIGANNTLILTYASQDKVNSSWYVADDPNGGYVIVGSDGSGLPYKYFKKTR